MRYFKVYKQFCRVHKAYYELTEGEFNVEAGDYASENTPSFEDEDGNIDYASEDAAMSEVVERVTKEAKTEDGFDYGDYVLYIRDDDADMYDIPRQTR